MHEKKAFTLLILLFLLEPSSAFLPDQLDIDHGQLFNKREVGTKDVLDGAEILASFFNEKSEYSQKFPSTHKFVNELVKYGAKTITPANIGYLGTSVYLGAVVVSSYWYLVHSRKLLAEVKSIDHMLNVAIEQEIHPVLQAIEIVLNERTGIDNLCDKKLDVMKMLKQRRDKIHFILNSIKTLRNAAIEGEERSEAFQIGTVSLAVIGCAIAAPIVAPSVLGVSLVVGIFGAAGTLGYARFWSSKQGYQKSLKLLDRLENKTRAAEKALAMLETKIECGCIFGFNSLLLSYALYAVAVSVTMGPSILYYI